jgi:hypothetical protein
VVFERIEDLLATQAARAPDSDRGSVVEAQSRFK